MKDSDCVVLGFDITNEESFKNIQDYWYPKSKEISGANLFYLVGNKIDLALDRKVDKNIARKFAEENGTKYFEISCLTSEGMNIFFEDLKKSIFGDDYELLIESN